MTRRKAKKVVKRSEDEGIQREDKEGDFADEEAERQISAIRAIRDVEVEQSLTALRLLRSYFTEEQLQTPVLDFFNDNLPGFSIARNEENGEIELKWNGSSMSDADGLDLPDNVKASLLGTDDLNLHCLPLFSGGSWNLPYASAS